MCVDFHALTRNFTQSVNKLDRLLDDVEPCAVIFSWGCLLELAAISRVGSAPRGTQAATGIQASRKIMASSRKSTALAGVHIP